MTIQFQLIGDLVFNYNTLKNLEFVSVLPSHHWLHTEKKRKEMSGSIRFLHSEEYIYQAYFLNVVTHHWGS
jgi:hypothetical protein